MGGKAVSATILTGGYLELTADRKVGADTTLSQIIQLMEQAASGKAPISRLADKISAVFVPVVISIALLAAILWAAVGGMGVRFCLSIAIAVLVISCPLRSGPGHAGGHHCGYGQGGGAGYSGKVRRQPGTDGPSGYGGAGQDRHRHRG